MVPCSYFFVVAVYRMCCWVMRALLLHINNNEIHTKTREMKGVFQPLFTLSIPAAYFCNFPFSIYHKLFVLLCAGENAIVIVSGANSKLTPKDVNRASELVLAAKVVVCQLEVPKETTLEALKLGRQGGGVYA